jgi:hypothetical protein
MGKSMNRHAVLTFLVLIFFLFGCLHSPHPVSAIDGPSDALQLQIWTSSDNPQPGDTVQLRTTVTNHKSATQIVQLTDRPVLDIQVSDQGRALHWSDGKSLGPALTQIELKGGESKSIEMDWTTPPNSYGQLVMVSGSFVYNARFAANPLVARVLIHVGPFPSP